MMIQINLFEILIATEKGSKWKRFSEKFQITSLSVCNTFLAFSLFQPANPPRDEIEDRQFAAEGRMILR